MFDFGWQEFLLIGIIAVLVVGPKDLPRVIRTIGQWVRKARALAGEFQSSVEELARESELDDVRKQVQQMSRDGLSKTVESHIDPDGDLRQSVEDAKAASGVDEIEQEMRDLQRDTRAIATASSEKTMPDTATPTDEPRDPMIETAEDYAAKYAAVKIPDNSIHPPTEQAPPSAEAAPAKQAKPPAVKKTAARKPATAKKAPAKRASTKPTVKTAPKTKPRVTPEADQAPVTKA